VRQSLPHPLLLLVIMGVFLILAHHLLLLASPQKEAEAEVLVNTQQVLDHRPDAMVVLAEVVELLTPEAPHQGVQEIVLPVLLRQPLRRAMMEAVVMLAAEIAIESMQVEEEVLEEVGLLELLHQVVTVVQEVQTYMRMDHLVRFYMLAVAAALPSKTHPLEWGVLAAVAEEEAINFHLLLRFQVLLIQAAEVEVAQVPVLVFYLDQAVQVSL
jgi:hypothetical protein